MKQNTLFPSDAAAGSSVHRPEHTVTSVGFRPCSFMSPSKNTLVFLCSMLKAIFPIFVSTSWW